MACSQKIVRSLDFLRTPDGSYHFRGKVFVPFFCFIQGKLLMILDEIGLTHSLIHLFCDPVCTCFISRHILYLRA